jgi:hypothetical protein
MAVNVDVPHTAWSSIRAVNSPIIAISRLFSTIEYASRLMLLDLAKHHNVQLPALAKKDVLGVLATSHSSADDCRYCY